MKIEKIKKFLSSSKVKGAIKEYCKLISNGCALGTSLIVILNIVKVYGVVISLPWFLPIPLIAIICYIIASKLPDGIERIKKELEKHNIADLTEEDQKSLDELRSVVDDKCSVCMTSRTETTLPYSRRH